MKELSLEEKARAYDKALKRAKELISRCIDDRDRRTKVYRVEDIESIFLELKESEDERIKKAITHVLYENYTDAAVIEGVEIAEIITWLEKQGKQSVEPE